MPSPLLQLRIPQDLADWLEAKYPSRGEVAEYVRQLLTAEQMKEAVAPLVPEGLAGPTHWSKGRLTDEDWASFQGGAGFETPEPKPKARRKKRYEVAPTPEFSITTNSVQTPARCNRGACTGTIKPNGHCMICNQRPRIQDW